jgi:predicted DsbA family dithiol-disulfide isomerase
MSPGITALHEQYPEDLRIIFKHLPVKRGNGSVLAARAAVSAHFQGKFWEMHDALFSEPRKLDETVITGIAHGIGLDIARFETDCRRAETADFVRQDEKLASRWGISGAPTVVVNGIVVTGQSSRAKLAGYVEYYLGPAGLRRRKFAA